MERLNETMVVAHATTVLAWSQLGQAVRARAQRLEPGDERGDVEARTITIAIMAALALAVGVIIVGKVTAKANSISLDE